jgi:23S rRNA pseudouridine2605 synthase
MRVNKFIALHTDYSRRGADKLVEDGHVQINGVMATPGQEVSGTDVVTLDGRPIHTAQIAIKTIMLNKPKGYVVSRDGQGSPTVYDLLPPELHNLNPVGRLDKNSSGLLLLTNDGSLAETLTHPRYGKQKTYEVKLDKPLQPLHHQMISDIGITLEDGVSKLILERLKDSDNTRWTVRMHEGRNRQIRRTFTALGYEVRALHRTHFGPYQLASLKPGASVTI